MSDNPSKKFIVAVNSFPRRKPVLLSCGSLEELVTKAIATLKVDQQQYQVIIDRGEDAGMEVTEDEVLLGLAGPTRIHLCLVPSGTEWTLEAPNAPMPAVPTNVQGQAAGVVQILGGAQPVQGLGNEDEVHLLEIEPVLVIPSAPTPAALPIGKIKKILDPVLLEMSKIPPQPDLFDVQQKATQEVVNIIKWHLADTVKDFTLPTARLYSQSLFEYSNGKYAQIFACIVGTKQCSTGFGWFSNKVYGGLAYLKNKRGLQNSRGPRAEPATGADPPTHRIWKVRKNYCCPQYFALLPEEESEASQEQKRLTLLSEFQQAERASGEVLAQWHATFPTRHNEIVKTDMEQVPDVVVPRWPYLLNAQCLLKHASILCRPKDHPEEFWDCQAVWDSKLGAVVEPTFKFFESYWRLESRRKRPTINSTKATAMIQIADQVKEAAEASRSKFKKIVSLFEMIGTYMHEDLEYMFVHVEEHANDDSIREAVRKIANKNPVIVIKGNDMYEQGTPCQVRFLDTQVILAGDILEAILVYFMTFHVFDFCYTKEVHSTLEYIQRVFLCMNEPGDRRESSRRNVSDVDTSVLKLSAAIHKFIAPFTS